MENKEESIVKCFLLTGSQLRALEAFLPQQISLQLQTLSQPKSKLRPAPIAQNWPETKVEKSIGTPAVSAISPAATKVRPREIISLVNKLKKFEKIGPFLYPVDPVALNIPDYFTIITRPMDVSTVETKARNGDYDSLEAFERDVMLIVQNAMRYNPPGHIINTMAAELEQYFKEILEQPAQIYEAPKAPKAPHVESKAKPVETKKAKKPFDDTPLAYGEKIALADMIKNKLSPESLWEVLRIVAPGATDTENIVFDIDKIPNKEARELQKYVLSQVGKKNNKKKVEEAPREESKEPTSAQTASQKGPLPEPVPLVRQQSSSSNWATSEDEF